MKSSPAAIRRAGSPPGTSFPGQPKPVPAGLPAEILARRPDLIAAERRFAVAFHRTREARTARLRERANLHLALGGSFKSSAQ